MSALINIANDKKSCDFVLSKLEAYNGYVFVKMSLKGHMVSICQLESPPIIIPKKTLDSLILFWHGENVLEKISTRFESKEGGFT
jgi:hypothetical protein